MPDPEKYFTAQLIVNQCFYNLLKCLSKKCPKKVLFMSTFCHTFEMSTKRNTSKTQVMKVKEAVIEINKAKNVYASIVTRIDGDTQLLRITKEQALAIINGYDRDAKVRVRILGYDSVIVG